MVQPEQIDEDHRSWADWARRLPRSAFICWLAGHVADELIAHKARRTSLDELAQAVLEKRSSDIQCDAECFIEKYYFVYPSNDLQFQRMVRVFRRLVRRKLLHYKRVV